MARAHMHLLLAALLALGSLVARSEAAAVSAEAEERAAAEAAAEADPGTNGSSFFDTFMAFLGSSALHQHQPADGEGEEAVAAASDPQQQHAEHAEQGRSLYGDVVAGAPLQDGGQADRVKRTGALPASLLGTVVNHKLGYLSKGTQHIHFHNYGTKCEKPHFSLWDFKKALLAKLLEAAKAIGGGVLALKGKLITAKGHLVAAKGRKLATKGEELTEFGKSILAKALGHGGHEVHEEVHTAPSAPSGPAAPYAAYSAPLVQPQHGYNGYNYGPPQAQYGIAPPPSAHGYNAAVSLLGEYSRAGFGYAPAPSPAHAHSHVNAHGQAHGQAHGHALGQAHGHAHGSSAQHRVGMAPTGPSATGPAGTLPGNLQAGLLVLQAAPSAPQSTQRAGNGALAAASSQYSASVPAPDAAPVPSPDGNTMSLYSPEGSSSQSAPPSQPLVLAPEYMDVMSAAEMSNKVRRYAMLPSSRRSLDVAMAAVVRGLQGSDLLLNPHIVRSAATRLGLVAES